MPLTGDQLLAVIYSSSAEHIQTIDYGIRVKKLTRLVTDTVEDYVVSGKSAVGEI